MRMEPLTVFASTSLARLPASTSPFTVLPMNFTPSGTRTVKSTLTSLSCVLMCPPSPGSHRFSRRPSLGYTAQIVTPPSSSTTSILTSSGSERWACFTAVTSVSPLPATARTSPFTPLISIAFPGAMRPFQWNSVWAAERSSGRSAPAARLARPARVETRMVTPPWIRPPAGRS